MKGFSNFLIFESLENTDAAHFINEMWEERTKDQTAMLVFCDWLQENDQIKLAQDIREFIGAPTIATFDPILFQLNYASSRISSRGWNSAFCWPYSGKGLPKNMFRSRGKNVHWLGAMAGNQQCSLFFAQYTRPGNLYSTNRRNLSKVWLIASGSHQIAEVYEPENISVENLIRLSLPVITEERNLQFWREDPRVQLSIKEKLFCLLVGFIDGPALRPRQLTGGDRPSSRFS